jgi:cytochrome P450
MTVSNDSPIADYPFPRPAPFEAPPQYAELRQAPPTRVRLPFGSEPWLVTRYEDVRKILADTQMSSNTMNPALPQVSSVPPGPSRMSFLKMDEPEHGRLRRMLTPEFTLRRIQLMRPAISAQAERLADEMADAGAPADLLGRFALPLPSLVTAELLGLPPDDREFILRTTAVIAAATSDPGAVGRAFGELTAYLDRFVGDLPTGSSGTLLERVAAQYVATGELEHDEFVAMARLLVLAGHETTAQMITMSVAALLHHPDQLAVLIADPSAIPRAVEELLRYITTTQYGIVRVAQTDVEVGGCPIAKGDGVIVSLPAANRDPAVFGDSEGLDLSRDASRHLAFGHGVHLCLGQSLARLEIEVSLTTLLRRLPALRLAASAAGIPFRGHHSFTYGTDELPVTW